MNLFMRANIALLTLLASAGASCGAGNGPATGNDPVREDASDPADGQQSPSDAAMSSPTSAGVQFSVRQAGEGTGLPANVGGGIVVSAATLLVHKLTLSGDNGSARVEGNWAIDLAPAIAPAVNFADPRPALYSRLNIEFEAEGTKSITPAFEGLRLCARIAGTLPSGAHFVIRNAAEVHVNPVAAAPFDLKPGGKLDARVQFDVNQWFTGITFPAGVDPVEIDAQQNADILARFRSNLVQSATLTFQ